MNKEDLAELKINAKAGNIFAMNFLAVGYWGGKYGLQVNKLESKHYRLMLVVIAESNNLEAMYALAYGHSRMNAMGLSKTELRLNTGEIKLKIN